LLLAGIERTQPRFGVANPGLDAAHPGGDVDQLRIELAAVLADRGDIGLEFGLLVRGIFLLRAGGLELLPATGSSRSGSSTTARSKAACARPMPDRDRGRCQGKKECTVLVASIGSALSQEY
jgi:hypothetical protein